MSFLTDLVQTTQKVIGHAKDEIIGTLNPDRRHDEPHEKAQDEARKRINESHRYHSFADIREGNFVKWHIDGHDYMWAVSELLENAKEAIFILDWWLTPELYLRRPPAKHRRWRLDHVLKRKAEQGVKIHIVIYKEVTQTMSLGSKHTKNYLEGLHENIAVMRHPDHIGSKDSVQFWSHHEKVVVVDNHYACIGGLDLCFGRWDTHNHPLADVHPTDFSQTLFPGQDYNNARIMDFQDVHYFASNVGVSVLESPRMPWHDVHMTLTGPAVLDIIQHFVERWNEIKKRKYKDSERVRWLSLPHDVEAAPNEAVVGHPHREHYREIGHHYRQRFHRRIFGGEEDQGQERGGHEHEEGYPYPAAGATCRVQAVRSVSDWSHGVLTEKSIQAAYIQLINEANHFIYIENQFFITATKEGEQVTNLIGKALVDRILRAHKDGKRFKVFVAIPEVPGFAGNVKDETSLRIIMAAQYRSINRGGSSIYERLRAEGVEPLDYIRFYHLRSYDRINAPMESYIKRAADASGVSFDEAQVALARQWIGNAGVSEQNEVELKVATASTQDGALFQHQEQKQSKTVKIKVPESEEAAVEIIERFERAAKEIRGDEDVSDNVVQHMLLDRTGLEEEKWLGTEQEELDSYVSELLYIHSKLMIVDDMKVIMGSANINDRSQKGDGDSEIALVIEDTDLVESRMDGERFMAAKFATTLRRQLFREHLGLIPPQYPDHTDDHPNSFMRPAPHPNDSEFGVQEDKTVEDPISEELLDLWNDTAKKNREAFTEVFRPVPTNLVRTWKALENYAPKVKTGHVRPDIELATVKERLSRVRGALVECPLDFLIDEKDFVEGPQWIGLDPTLPIYI